MLRPADAAKLIGLHEYSVRRLCDLHDIGAKLGPEPAAGVPDNRPWILTTEDVKKLRQVAKIGTGRPPAAKATRRKSRREKG